MLPWLVGQFQQQLFKLEIRRIKAEGNKQFQRRNIQANLLIQQAQDALSKDRQDPFDLDRLTAAIDYYHQSYRLSNSYECLKSIEPLEAEIDRRRQFQWLFQAAIEDIQNQRFGDALARLESARAMYAPTQLLATIDLARQEYPNEKVYLEALELAKELSYAGNFRAALIAVDRAVANFDREDGQQLKIKLSRAIAAREQLNSGKIEQSLGNLAAATTHYQSALILLPQWREPQLQLAIIAAQTAEFSTSIDALAEIELPHTNRLLGWLYLRQRQYRQAHAVWSDADREMMREYGRSIVDATQSQRQPLQTEIQKLIASGNFELARSQSLEFIEEFGGDILIETNLRDCILPAIETRMWATRDWARLAVFAREQWRERVDIDALHNWAISLYYATQSNGNLEELIIAWAAAIANIDLDPSIQDRPWLGTKSKSSQEIEQQLWQILERRIESIKAVDLSRYLTLRDLFRQEFWAIEIAKTQANAKLVVNELIIPPGCYRADRLELSLGNELNIWKTLYTKLGKVVAACLAGDFHRAKALPTHSDPTSELEQFALRLICYYLGCNYLQQADWKSAIYLLNTAKPTIVNNCEWYERIDELCADLRQKIEDFEEHQAFGKFWNDLLSSERSEEYAIEYRALAIQYDWQTDTVADSVSLERIEDLYKYYADHLVVVEVYNRIYQHSLSLNN